MLRKRILFILSICILVGIFLVFGIQKVEAACCPVGKNCTECRVMQGGRLCGSFHTCNSCPIYANCQAWGCGGDWGCPVNPVSAPDSACCGSGTKYGCTSPNTCTQTAGGTYSSESDCLDGPGQCGNCVACKCWAGGSIIAGESSSPPSSYASSQESVVLGESTCLSCQSDPSSQDTFSSNIIKATEDIGGREESFDQVLEKAKLFWAVITDFIKGFIN